MAMGMYKKVQANSVESMLAKFYEMRYLDGITLQPIYTKFVEQHKEIIIRCHEIENNRTERPEYHVGALEVAYGELLKLLELDPEVGLTDLEELQEASMKYRRSTKI